MITSRRVFAALKGSKRVPVFIKQCRVIVDKVHGNAWFPAPYPDLGLISEHLDDLAKAELEVPGGAKGAAQVRNVKLGLVRSDMRQLVAHVQAVVDDHLNEGRAIIETAGLTVAKSTARRPKPPFAAKRGKIAGRVLLEARSPGKNTTFYWQISADEATWLDLPDTLVASTAIDGLTPGATYFFRFRAMRKGAVSAWSVVVPIMAH